MYRPFRSSACITALFVCPTLVHAQWAVVDAPAIAQLIQEVQTMQQQLQTARAQLQSAEQGVRAITGDRGMEGLLADSQRNYLPVNWTQLIGVREESGAGYSGLASQVHAQVAANTVLTAKQLSELNSGEQAQITNARQWVSLRQALAQEALSHTSARFASLQALIAAIATAQDSKASTDLQARISAEIGMLENEQTKLEVLAEASNAEERALVQQSRERVIAGHGSFDSRFQPIP